MKSEREGAGREEGPGQGWWEGSRGNGEDGARGRRRLSLVLKGEAAK